MIHVFVLRFWAGYLGPGVAFPWSSTCGGVLISILQEIFAGIGRILVLGAGLGAGL